MSRLIFEIDLQILPSMNLWKPKFKRKSVAIEISLEEQDCQIKVKAAFLKLRSRLQKREENRKRKQIASTSMQNLTYLSTVASPQSKCFFLLQTRLSPSINSNWKWRIVVYIWMFRPAYSTVLFGHIEDWIETVQVKHCFYCFIDGRFFSVRKTNIARQELNSYFSLSAIAHFAKFRESNVNFSSLTIAAFSLFWR